MPFKKRKIAGVCLLVLLAVGFVLPQKFTNPVEHADKHSYNPNSFWYYPWGRSGTHKGVDIFAKAGTTVRSATGGLVVYKGNLGMGGKVVLILGPKWRLHYYAHLQTIETEIFSWTSKNEKIGTVGTSGNAKGKAPHLHYSIMTVFPYPWRIDGAKQGWKKMFYLNPITYLQRGK